MISESITQVRDGQSLTEDQMAQVIDWIMKGNAEDAQIAALLTALFEKGETVEELAGAARAMRWHMNPIKSRRENLIDTCGTGGGGAGTFNISTAAAIIAAAAGAAVAKHGNRKSTSKTGSADVLQELGVNIECDSSTVEKCMDEIGIGFCFAPLFHPSVRHVMNVRRSLPHPTVFNLLGPLCNPAEAPFQVLGAGRGETRELIAAALALLGTERSLVLHSHDGLGEISNTAVTDVCDVSGNEVTNVTMSPADFGIESEEASLKAENPAESAAIIKGVVDGNSGPHRDIVVINAAAAVWVSGVADSPVAAAERCQAAIDGGEAQRVLARLIELTS
ncbi:MAG: anthranilate phosphoribosyltransferase [Planctomycetota bacterium]